MKRLILVWTLCALWSCKNHEVTFAEPQPKDVGEKSGIPNRFIGTFENPENGSTLTVTNNSIVLHSYLEERVKISDLDSTYQLKGNRLVNLSTKESIEARTFGDSISWKLPRVDTVYDQSRKDVLKKFKGFYFVSQFLGESDWYVRKLEMRRNLVTLADISTEEDFAKLKPLAQKVSVSDSVAISYQNLKASKKQFRKFVKDKGFAAETVFLRKQDSRPALNN